jgi:hypothetical protein
MSISSLEDDALIVPFEPTLLRWNCALFNTFFCEEEEEIKADDLAEAAAKDEDANIALPFCFVLRVF